MDIRGDKKVLMAKLDIARDIVYLAMNCGIYPKQSEGYFKLHDAYQNIDTIMQDLES